MARSVTEGSMVGQFGLGSAWRRVCSPTRTRTARKGGRQEACKDLGRPARSSWMGMGRGRGRGSRLRRRLWFQQRPVGFEIRIVTAAGVEFDPIYNSGGFPCVY